LGKANVSQNCGGYGPRKVNAVSVGVKVDEATGIGDEEAATGRGVLKLDSGGGRMAGPAEFTCLNVKAEKYRAIGGIERVAFAENHVLVKEASETLSPERHGKTEIPLTGRTEASQERLEVWLLAARSTGKSIGPCGENAAKAIGDGFAGEDPGLRDERSGSVRVDVLKRFPLRLARGGNSQQSEGVVDYVLLVLAVVHDQGLDVDFDLEIHVAII